MLACLAEEPKYIHKLFESNKKNEFGIYSVFICKNGEWKEVVVDDFLPCNGTHPAFSRANGPELWVCLLEKAWAKLHGSYERIEAGFPQNVFRDLTGAPAITYVADEDNIWNYLVEAINNKWLMSSSTEASHGKEAEE